MNKLILLVVIITLCYPISLTAQLPTSPKSIDEYVILDTTRVVVKYSLYFVVNPEKPETIDTDIVVLEIGHKVSKSYSYLLFKYDSIATASTADNVPMLQKRVPPIEVFKNFPSGKNTVVHRTLSPGPIFMYEDDMNIDWTILPERKQLFGYSSQKATTTFRGRTWEAWFTGQIPISDGPWKFHGLPGLILEVSDDQNHFRFTIVGLSREKVPIKKWKWRYERTTRENVNDYMRRFNERPLEMLRQMGSGLHIAGRSQAEVENFSFPHNPLELE